MHIWQKNMFVLFVLMAGFVLMPLCSGLPGPAVSLVLSPSYPYTGQMTGSTGYSPLEPVNLNITLRNEGPGPVTILGVPPRIGINRIEGKDIRTWPRNDSIAVLQEGESMTTPLTWDQRDDNGVPVAPGIYTFGVYYLYRQGDFPGTMDLSGARPLTGTARIRINHPGGPLIQNLTLEMTREDNGVHATLVSLESGSGKGILSFDVEIPEKVQDVTPRPEGIVPCDVNAYPVAKYRIDQGNFQKFLDMDFICDVTPRQVHRDRLYFEPIPADAKVMDIHITRFGHHNGSWDYSVDLTGGTSATTTDGALHAGTTGNLSSGQVPDNIPQSRPTQKSASMPGSILVISAGLGALLLHTRLGMKY